MKSQPPVVFKSIAALHRSIGMPMPLHPLISVINYGKVDTDLGHLNRGMIMDFYKISFKTNFNGRIRYGQGYYDFESGGMSFISPGQLIKAIDEEADYDGMSLHVHPDFFSQYPLGRNIKEFGFFSYTAAEALYLSEKEKETIMQVFANIQDELEQRIDQFSQDVIISQVELLLNYANRFYNRQFITRKSVNSGVLSRFELSLNNFYKDNSAANGLPSVQYFADELNMSPHYLGDLLRSLTGMNTQQHIQNKLVDMAKVLLAEDRLTISEIAYQLGFGHPQSFNRVFKKAANITPVAYRKQMLN